MHTYTIQVKRPKLYACIFLLCTFCLVTGFMDLDWMLVSYRYSEWHRSVDYWEFNPYFKPNWYIAYISCLARIIIGVGFFSYLLYKRVI